jgi:hypothetical protein
VDRCLEKAAKFVGGPAASIYSRDAVSRAASEAYQFGLEPRYAVLDRSATTAAMFVVFRHECDGLVDEEARRRMRLTAAYSPCGTH